MKERFNPKLFHHFEPDYTKPGLKISSALEKKLMQKLSFLYGKERATEFIHELVRIIQVYYAHKSDEMKNWESRFTPEDRFTEKDTILITYGDLITSRDEKPLETLTELCNKYLKGIFNTIHLLPFFPFSSDRGFSVMDFEEVDPNLGTWEDILALKSDFKLMFDGVINHVSSRSRWFQEFLNQKPYYRDFFTVFSTKDKISQEHLNLIVRPRTSDVLTEYKTLIGPRLVWTTFSPDQIDLNYQNPNVLIKMLEILLLYVLRGADIIRLDAVTYLWDEMGTTSVHLEETHTCIKLFRDVLDEVAPHVALITETNVPHEENIQYFGNGRDEAQMVYNFALPPLVLHTFQTENSEELSKWAADLEMISSTASYFNFLDSHDGIGVMAVKNILSKEQIDLLALRVLEHGGYISYKDNGDGTESPYELNITWYSAINREDSPESRELKIKRYIASRAIALVIMGVPGIYLHGLLGSRNDADAVIEEGHTRSINRKTINKNELLTALNDDNSTIYLIAEALVTLVSIRRKEKSFHPNAAQKVYNLSPDTFIVQRISGDQTESVISIINITNHKTHIAINRDMCLSDVESLTDLLSTVNYQFKNDILKIELDPYAIIWLRDKK